MCILSFKEILRGWSQRDCLKWTIQSDAYSHRERETEHCSDRREYWNANGRLVSAATHLSRCSCTSEGLGSAGVRLAARLTYDWAKLVRSADPRRSRVQRAWNCIKLFLTLSRGYTWITCPLLINNISVDYAADYDIRCRYKREKLFRSTSSITARLVPKCIYDAFY